MLGGLSQLTTGPLTMNDYGPPTTQQTKHTTPGDRGCSVGAKCSGKPVFCALHCSLIVPTAAHDWQPSGIFTAEDTESRRGVAGNLKIRLDRSALPSANLGIPCGELLDLPGAVRPNLGRCWPEAGKFYYSLVKDRQPALTRG